MRPALTIVLVVAAMLPAAFGRSSSSPSVDARPGGAAATKGPARLLVRFRSSTSRADRARVHRHAGGTIRHRFDAPGLELVEAPAGMGVSEALDRYRREQAVEHAEPDWAVRITAVPDDPRFGEQWQLENTGQTGGTPDADINATGAWDLTTGSAEVVVAVIDSGIDYTHPDLAANVWVNPGEIPGNGIDDDGNGWVDDVHGIDVLAGTGDPMDGIPHGTQMAGLIAAVGNNGVGTTGVGWSTRVLGCKFIDSTGQGTLSGALACFDYVRALKTRPVDPVNVVAINASWSGAPYSQELTDAIVSLRAAGIVFVASAGNAGESVDDPTSLSHPAGIGLPLVVAVGGSDASDDLWTYSNFGATAVHLLAPSTSLLTTTHGGGYVVGSGTSHAAALTSGVVALIASQDPARSAVGLIGLLLAGAQPISAAVGVTATGRRLRAWDAGGVGSLTCMGQLVQARLQPSVATLLSVRGRGRVPLSMLSLDCGAPGPVPSVGVDGGGSVTLGDDGAAPDLFAADGVFVGTWAVPGDADVASYTLRFAGADSVAVQVLDTYRTAEVVPYEWRTIAGQALALANDASAPITVPFAIPFGHLAGGLTTVWVHSNGYLAFSGALPWSDNEPLPSGRLGTAVAPFWDDLDPATAGIVVWDVLGAAPHRELVVDWRGVAHVQTGADDTLEFQAVLFEDRADVLFSYADVSVGDPTIDGGASATVGIQEAAPAAGGVSTSYSFDTASISAGLSLLWRANEPPRATVGPDRTARAGETVAVDGSGSLDPDGTVASYAWRQTAGPPVALSSPDAAVTSFVAPCGPATIELELSVTDADGAVGRARTRVLVGNAPPAIAVVTPAGPTLEGDALEAELVVTDPDGAAGGPYRVAWAWGDGSSDTTTLAAPGTIVVPHSYSDDDGSPFEISAEVTDRIADDGFPGPESLAASATATVVVANAPPEVLEVRVTPESPRVGEPVTIAVIASDPGTDALSYSFDFDADGVYEVVDSADARATTIFQTAGARVVAVLVRDDDGGEARATATSIVADAPPAGVPRHGCAETGGECTAATFLLTLLTLRRLSARRVVGG